MSSIDMNEMVCRLAWALLAENGPFFLSVGDNGAQNIALLWAERNAGSET